MNLVVQIFQIISYIVGAASLIIAAITYKKSNKIKRAEWTKTIFEKFFEGDKYSEVRMQVDYDSIKTYLAVDNEGNCQNKVNEEKWVNYLNFFEFIAILRSKGHLTLIDVNDILGYYLSGLRKDEFIKTYLNRFGFKNLEKLLK